MSLSTSNKAATPRTMSSTILKFMKFDSRAELVTVRQQAIDQYLAMHKSVDVKQGKLFYSIGTAAKNLNSVMTELRDAEQWESIKNRNLAKKGKEVHLAIGASHGDGDMDVENMNYEEYEDWLDFISSQGGSLINLRDPPLPNPEKDGFKKPGTSKKDQTKSAAVMNAGKAINAKAFWEELLTSPLSPYQYGFSRYHMQVILRPPSLSLTPPPQSSFSLPNPY